jgi:hypothetical protein
LEIVDQPRRPAPASSFDGGVIDRKARIIEQTHRSQSFERCIDRGRRVLFF